MEHLPVFINLRQKPCLVVGGGEYRSKKSQFVTESSGKNNVHLS